MTSIRQLKNGIGAFPAMFQAVDHSTLSIALEKYVLADDNTGRLFREHLIESSKLQKGCSDSDIE